MANLLEVGVEFESFDAFQAAMEQYEDSQFVQFTRIDSRSVEKAQEVTPTKVYSPVIQFVQLTYACTYGPRKVASKSSGIRNASSRKIDCPVRLRISSTPDGQRLVIRESKLDGHNHEVSEALYKSMARQKQLDEETELEIYSLISMHTDKRLARILVRDRLTQEMGRSISIKDILNIEKKICRRLEREKISEGDASVTFKSTVKTPEEEQAQERLGEGEINGELAELCSAEVVEESHKNVEEQEGANGDGEEEQQKQMEEQNVEDAGDTKPDTESDSNTEKDPQEQASPTLHYKTPPSKRMKSEPSSTIRRPQRHRREPSRFRDALTNGTKVLHTSKDKVVSIVSPEEAEELMSADPETSRPEVKTREEGSQGVRGRKRKQEEKRSSQSSADTEAELSEYRKRKLAIQEELLDMGRQKMKILNDIVDKLDQIIQNQNKT